MPAILLALTTIAAFVPALARDKKDDLKRNYALIRGTVWTADNQPAYGATVKIRRADEKKVRWELNSNHNGEFAQRVPPGTADYVVTAEMPGKNRQQAETKVHIENDERADIGLHFK